MSLHSVVLQGRDDVAERTLAFRFARPASFAFKPGQAIDVVLPSGSGDNADDLRHTFSIVSAPFEDAIVIATRMRDTAYKRSLASLAVGSEVQVEGPFGSLTLPGDRARHVVLIAGGIGITPFISMLRHVTRNRRAAPVTLLYSNRRPEDAAYLDELEGLGDAGGGVRFVATMTGAGTSARPWTGRRGRIDAELVRAHTGAAHRPVFLVAGPPAMVAGVRKTLNDAGVDDDDIRSEDFFGY